jgi:hypothetical protein
MNLYEHATDMETFEPIRRQRRFTYGRGRKQATAVGGMHRRHRRQWQPTSKAGPAIAAR